MDSPAPRPDLARRGLATRRRLRLAAITLWTAFLGATLLLTAGLAYLPAVAVHELGWHGLSVAFLGAWALATAPVSLALLLAGQADGR